MIADDDRLLDVRVAGVDLRDEAIGGVQPGHDRAPVVHAVGAAGEAPAERRPQGDRLDALDDQRAGCRTRGAVDRRRPAATVSVRRWPARPPRSRSADGMTSSSSGGVYGIGRSSGRLTRRGVLAHGDAADGQLADDRGAPARGVDLLLGDDQPAGLLDGGPDGRQVERAQPAQVDDLGVDAVGGQRLGRGQRALDHQQRGDDRDVAARRGRPRPCRARRSRRGSTGPLRRVQRPCARRRSPGSWSCDGGAEQLVGRPGRARGRRRAGPAGA